MLILSVKTLNKFIRKIQAFLITLALLSTALPFFALAQAPPPGGNGSGASDTSLSAVSTPDELFYQFKYSNSNTAGTNIGAVNAIATTNSWQVVLANVVKTLLNVSGGLALLAFTVGGVLFVTARGKADQLDKGKKIIIFAIAGLVIIAVSYAIVIGVSDLQIFTPGAGGGSSAPAGGAPAAPASDGGSQA